MLVATETYPSPRAGSPIDLSGSAQWWIIVLMDDTTPPRLDKAQ
jgi:hypothetical protein